MALLLPPNVSHCGACLPECPNEAIFETRSDAGRRETMWRRSGSGRRYYVITHDRCTECVGHFDEPHVQRFVRSICCISDPSYPEPPDVLLRKRRTSS